MENTRKRIGIMGGTFDPIHNAHLALARQAYEQFSLDGIWMLPNGNPPHKRDTRQADMKCRLRMIELAIRDIPYLKFCEAERSSRVYHYTYETLQHLKEDYPDTAFYFIMGADSLFEFDKWREPDIISRECTLLAAARDHCQKEQIQERIQELKRRYKADILILDTPNMDIASADIRDMVARGEDISRMVPDAVAEYIRHQSLYKTGIPDY